jgi:hypothetical protein
MGGGGFSPVDPTGRPDGADLSFLRGASGIGLVLLGAATAVDPLWDRLLLLSSPLGAPSLKSRENPGSISVPSRTFMLR